MNFNSQLSPHSRTAIIIGMKPWKKLWQVWFDETVFMALPRSFPRLLFSLLWAKRIKRLAAPTVYTWGMKYPEFLDAFCAQENIPLIHVEDGFIRSVGFGRDGQAPLSLVFDRGLHFNALHPSLLEEMLEAFHFEAHPPAFKQAAEKSFASFLKSGLSKYNCGRSATPDALYGSKTCYRIMVLGQVEGDASLRFGNPQHFTSVHLLQKARQEHPDAQIIYRPHPAAREKIVLPENCLISENIALHDALESVDHVYTITSLSGFEAALRGKRVTVFGTPFYAGWGFTDDRLVMPRRTNRLTPYAVFTVAYLLYPRYFHPETGKKITFDEAIAYLEFSRQQH